MEAMSEALPLDHFALSDMLHDSMILRMVTAVNATSLSILELLEYGFERRDVNRAMAKGIIEFDKTPLLSEERLTKGEVIQRVLESGDYYFGVLSSKVRLTKLGLYLLEVIEEGSQPAREGEIPSNEVEDAFGPEAPNL